MKRKHLRFGQGFQVIFGNARAQAARGIAKLGKRRLPIRAGTLLLIAHGDCHEILNNGRAPLKTLNLYTPPAYTKSGEELPAARSD